MSATPNVLDHVDAVTAALTAAQITWYLGGAPAGIQPTDAAPYVVLYPEPGAATAFSLADERIAFQAVVQLTSVGVTAEQALSVADRARAALTPAPAVAGRVSWKPEQLDGQPVRRDDQVTPPVWFAVSRYRLRSIPA